MPHTAPHRPTGPAREPRHVSPGLRRAPLVLAVLALGGGLAQAQPAPASPAGPATSVTLYGLVDLGVGQFKGANTGVKSSDQKATLLVNGGLSTSHIGLRGQRDLGQGLSASFDLSAFVRADTGASGRADATTAGATTVSADPMWSRQSWVGLGHADLGRIRLGNSSTLLFINSITSNAFGDSTVFSPLNLVTFFGSPLSGGTGWTNQVIYESPRLAGFSLAAARSLAEGGASGGNGAVRLAWTGGPAAVSYAQQSVKKDPSTFADGLSANNTQSWQLGGSYDFQGVKVFAHVGHIDNQGTATTPLDLGYSLREISVSVPLGSGKLLAGTAQRKTGDAVGPVPASVNGGNVERKVSTLGYDVDLDKSTDAYVMLMKDSTVTHTVITGSAPQKLSASGSALAVGVRYRF